MKYSMDTSALIGLPTHYPEDLAVFAPVWVTIRRLAVAGRLLVHEVVREECLNTELQELIGQHPQVVVHQRDVLEYHVALLRDAGARGIQLAQPSDTRDKADPCVIATGLAFDGRSTDGLDQRLNQPPGCCVVTLEGRRGARSIPRVCELYDLSYISMVELLRREMEQ